jgi:hypothetical protein
MNQSVQMMGPTCMWKGFYEQFGSRHGMELMLQIEQGRIVG